DWRPESPPIRADENKVVSSISLSSGPSVLTVLILFVLAFFRAFFGVFFDFTNFCITGLLFTAGFFLTPALLIGVPFFAGLSFEFLCFFLIFLSEAIFAV